MKKTVLLPLAFFAVLMLLIGSACNFSLGKDSDETAEPQTIIITATPETVVAQQNESVATEAPVVEATEAPVYDEAQPFYLEEFDGDVSNFSMDTWGSGDYDLASVFAEDGQMKFEHGKDTDAYNGGDIYSYVYYDPYTYTDVRLDIEVENVGVNNNSVNLVCRYDPDLGWYEFNIDSDGEWALWYYDKVIAEGYTMLYNGGSTAVKMGRDTNIYTVTCVGEELSLYVNGELEKTVKNKDIKEGQIGFGISSYGVYPVLMNVNWLEISEP